MKNTPSLIFVLQLFLVGAGLSLAATNAEAICGDGAVEAGEACDDGNLNNGDGCNDACAIESPAGCADGIREGFSNVTTFPTIASCAGDWDVPGVRSQSSKQCLGHGNDGVAQTGCIASDLCAVGWHICGSSDDVLASAPSLANAAACNTAAVDNSPIAYFTSQTSGPGFARCSNNPSDHNDLFGCGSLGGAPNGTTCGLLGRFGSDQCSELTSDWTCPASFNEQVVITKTGTVGGVMCCFGSGAQVSLTAATLNSCVARPTVAGTALDSNGNPLNGALVSVSFPSGATVELITDSNGDFSVGWPSAEPDVIVGTSATIGAHVHDAVTNWNGATFQFSLNDADNDGICDSADLCTGNDISSDFDADGFCDNIDNCISIVNVSQADEDNDGIGDACDTINDLDVDGDGVPNAADNCAFVANADQADTDADGIGDICDTTDGLDVDGDGVLNASDNCPLKANADQADADADGIGDVCDQSNGLDIDGDGISNDVDPCPFKANSTDCMNGNGSGAGNFVDDCACSGGGRSSSSSWLFIGFAFVFGLRRRRHA